MNVVWPVTAFNFGPLTLWLYYRYGRLSAKDAPPAGDEQAAKREQDPRRKAELKTGKPFWPSPRSESRTAAPVHPR